MLDAQVLDRVDGGLGQHVLGRQQDGQVAGVGDGAGRHGIGEVQAAGEEGGDTAIGAADAAAGDGVALVSDDLAGGSRGLEAVVAVDAVHRVAGLGDGVLDALAQGSGATHQVDVGGAEVGQRLVGDVEEPVAEREQDRRIEGAGHATGGECIGEVLAGGEDDVAGAVGERVGGDRRGGGVPVGGERAVARQARRLGGGLGVR